MDICQFLTGDQRDAQARPVEGLLVAVVIVVAVISRPIEVRLWRAGKISDRTLAIVGLARFPILAFVFGLIVGASIEIVVLITAVAIVPVLMFYRFMLDLIHEQAAVR